MDKRKYIFINLIIISIIIIIGGFIIFKLKINDENISKINYAIKNNYSINQENSIDSIITNSNELKISPNAIITFKKYYKKCGDTIIESNKVNKRLVNLNENQLQKEYSDWTIKEFTNSKIELYKEINENCDEHYLVKEENNNVVIYNKLDDGKIKLYKKTNISTECLPNVDKESLNKGISIKGKEKLNAYLENLE